MRILNQFRRLLSDDRPQPVRVQMIQTSGRLYTVEDLPRGTESEKILADIIEQAVATSERYRIKLSGSERYKQLKDEPNARQVAVLKAAAKGVPLNARNTNYGNSWQVAEARKVVISQLLRRNIAVPIDLQNLLLRLWLNTGYSLEHSMVHGVTVLNAVERHASKHGLPEELRPILHRIDTKLKKLAPYRRNPNKWEQSVGDRIAALLDPESVENRPPLPSGDFADSFIAWLEEQPDGKRDSWQALAIHAATSVDKSAPAKKWVATSEDLLKALGRGVFVTGLLHWLGKTKPDPTHPDHSLDILKGMIWLAPLVKGDEAAGAIGRFAELCFRKVRGVGARSVKLGNATLYALSEMAGVKQAGGELFRLRNAIKYPSARKILDKRIAELADANGSDIATLEDAALPDHGIGKDGMLHADFGAAQAELTLSASGTEVAWYNEAGKQVKTPPAAAKADFKEELAAFKLAAKDIEKARHSQAKRLESGWLERRSWSLTDWRGFYCNHNLRRPLVEALIWQVEPVKGGTISVLPKSGRLYDVAGKLVECSDDDRISLWHPLHENPDQVLAWRQRIIDLALTQPIKQAHREIYVVTDAERQTAIYSNRFAAHILRQHQFRALCQARDWQYDFMGGWDSWNVPTRTLPALGLAAEFSVEPIEDGEHSDNHVPLHIATDQVRFIDVATRQPLPLVDVDPVIFSELMRDVDLFVAVTSVANDPAWTDGGPDGRFGAYWREWAFGDLGQSAETRRELVAAIVPKLSIADRLEIGQKALFVTGNRHKYAIHFGSTNIQILPENRYLCIVPARNPVEAEKIHLPFTGDGQLSTILAKAFMLVDESKIKDPTILTQLKRG